METRSRLIYSSTRRSEYIVFAKRHSGAQDISPLIRRQKRQAAVEWVTSEDKGKVMDHG